MAKTVYYAQSEAPITAVPSDLVIWGPGDPRPTLPIAGWNPGTGAWPKPPVTEPPPGIWGGSGEPFPTVPIAEPPWGWGNPPPKPTVPPASGWDVKYGWTPTTGWFVFAIPTGPVPTPSAKK
jgi:hypothetical protein